MPNELHHLVHQRMVCHPVPQFHMSHLHPIYLEYLCHHPLSVALFDLTYPQSLGGSAIEPRSLGSFDTEMGELETLCFSHLAPSVWLFAYCISFDLGTGCIGNTTDRYRFRIQCELICG